MGSVVSFDFSERLVGKRVLLRASLNVPVERGIVTNAFRLHESLKTIEALSKHGARTVVCGHVGREKTDSLFPIWQTLKKESRVPLRFVDDLVGSRAKKAAHELSDGDVLLLENVRRDIGEEKNDPVLAEALAGFGEVYINDAFSDSHRPHASIVGVPKFLPHFAGPLFMQELEGITPARTPESPSLAIIGGAKFLTKEPLLRTIMERYDHVFVGGALANDFLRAQGVEVGKSLVSGAVVIKDFLQNSKLLLPSDVVVSNPNGREIKTTSLISPNDTILDIGPDSLKRLELLVNHARFILWNGPLGNFERGFSEGTETMARLIASAKAHTVVGGGDTVAALERLTHTKEATHVSTAGGAMLQFIADGTLVGIEALQ